MLGMWTTCRVASNQKLTCYCAELGLVEEAQQTVEKWMARWIEIVSIRIFATCQKFWGALRALIFTLFYCPSQYIICYGLTCVVFSKYSGGPVAA